MSQDYNATINLPKTEFPMRAGLPKREPDMLKAWEQLDLYNEMLKRNEGKPHFNLHDGPPFSNGKIHMGTAMNKCLKDFINRYKSMSGYRMWYTPGWDNHGMPIESAIIKEQKLNHKAMSVSEFRSACHDFAMRFVNLQMDDFKRLGVVGDWDHPYLTMDPKFEAEEVKVFGKMFQKGYIYKGKKPVYWCPNDETALAEAEIEYAEDPVTTIFVKFRVIDDQGKFASIGQDVYFVIWTTTTWTLPGNVAICVNPAYNYSVVKASNGEVYVMAEDLAPAVLKKAGLEVSEILATYKGSELELMVAQHPIMDQTSLVICGDHVTLEAGSGCVHTAPAYGADDFMVCKKYPQLETGADMIVNVDDDGRFNEAAGKYAGLHVLKAHPPIFADLVECGAILASEDITHSYPHCWRCKKPIIFRATDQWFCSVKDFREEAVKACDEVSWSPDWGHDRMISMIRERADWCISRQRRWGLPIPVFYCADCGKPICTEETIEKVSAIFGEKGSNAWFDMDAAELLPEAFACPHCGGKSFTKETNTLDGWFDSGSTHMASMLLDSPAEWPCDIYLEGGDQYRGWFQSSLLTAVATMGRAPYKAVLTHGWTVDGEGKAMHKSLGNGVYPEEVIPKYGADLVRLWAASADYRLDMRCSDAIFKQLSDKYLKIRNTARYILGNLNGFDPKTDMVAYADMLDLDKWALCRLNSLVEKAIASYEKFEFYSVTYAVHNFCVTDMSNFYLDVIKDRLYCDDADGISRRSAQTAIYLILDTIVRLLAPVLSFTSDEIWLAMPHRDGDDVRNVCLNDMPKANSEYVLDEETMAKWDSVIALRTDVNKALEMARGEKIVGKPLDAEITLYVSDLAKARFETIADFGLAPLFIVSKVNVVDGEGEGYKGEQFAGITVKVEASAAPKCVRCWTHDEAVGTDSEHPELCPRCAQAVRNIK